MRIFRKLPFGFELNVDYFRRDSRYLEFWVGNEKHALYYNGHLMPTCPECGGEPLDEYDRFYDNYCWACNGYEHVGVLRWLYLKLWVFPRGRLFSEWLERVWWPATGRECPTCHGDGWLPSKENHELAAYGEFCPDCNGGQVSVFKLWRMRRAKK